MPYFEGRTVLRMLAQPQFESFTMEPESCSIYGGLGNTKLATFTTGMNINMGISFKPVIQQGKKTIFSLSVENDQ